MSRCRSRYFLGRSTGASSAGSGGGERGLPEAIVVDNGPEFRGRALAAWSEERGVRLEFIQPGKPIQNAYVESFNGRLRDECLNANWFTSLNDARRKSKNGGRITTNNGHIARWRIIAGSICHDKSGDAGMRCAFMDTIEVDSNAVPFSGPLPRSNLNQKLALRLVLRMGALHLHGSLSRNTQTRIKFVRVCVL